MNVEVSRYSGQLTKLFKYHCFLGPHVRKAKAEDKQKQKMKG
jgi:hypothetical protein